jgi:hypothetical protein
MVFTDEISVIGIGLITIGANGAAQLVTECPSKVMRPKLQEACFKKGGE